MKIALEISMFIVLGMLLTARCSSQELETVSMPSVATLMDGTRVQGNLLHIGADGAIVLQTALDVRSIPAAQFVAWGEFVEPRSGPVVVLAGGSLLCAEIQSIQSQRLLVRSTATKAAEFPRSGVRGVLLQFPESAVEADQILDRLMTNVRDDDEVWMRSGDRFEGRIMSPVSPTDAPVEELEVRPTLRPTVKVSVDHALALALKAVAREGQGPSRQLVAIGLRDGSRLLVDEIRQNNDDVELRLNDGSLLSATAPMLWQQICAIQSLGNHLDYLSDQPSLDYRHIPYLSIAWELGIDRNCAAGMFRHKGRVFLKGIGMHSNSRCAVATNGQFRRLDCQVGIDEATNGRGSVIFRVYAERREATDGDLAWTAIYESPVVRGGDPLVPISVDISGTNRIALVVDMADRGDLGDYANWFNARLIP